MSVRCCGAVWDYSRAKGGELLLLLAIADYAKDDGTGAWPSIEKLCAKTRFSERNVHYLLRNLQRLGEISVEKGAGPHGCNIYSIMLAGWDAGSDGDARGAKIAGAKIAGVQNPVAEGCKDCGQGVQPIAPNPSVTVKEPSPIRQRRPAPRQKTLTAEQQVRFDRWYAAYPRHAHRREAEQAWRRLDPDDAFTGRLIDDVQRRQSGRKWAEGYIEHPATYLNQGAWDDDIEATFALRGRHDHNSAQRGKVVV